MKMIVLKILTVLIALIAVLCLIAAFTVKKYTIKREVTINAPVKKVYGYVENKQIDFKIRFIAPYPFAAHGSLYFRPVDENQSTVSWEYHSGMNWPMNITLLFMDMDKIIGADIQSTLDKIKLNTETI